MGKSDVFYKKKLFLLSPLPTYFNQKRTCVLKISTRIELIQIEDFLKQILLISSDAGKRVQSKISCINILMT